jgi:hypothetical protein
MQGNKTCFVRTTVSPATIASMPAHADQISERTRWPVTYQASSGHWFQWDFSD